MNLDTESARRAAIDKASQNWSSKMRVLLIVVKNKSVVRLEAERMLKAGITLRSALRLLTGRAL